MKKKNVLIVVFSVAIIGLIVGLLANQITMSGRLTYSSKSEMVEDLNGVWVCRYSDGDVRSKIIVDYGDVVKYDYLYFTGKLQSTSEYEFDYEDIEFNYSRGYFKLYDGAYGKYIVKSNGNIVNTETELEYQKTSSNY